MVSKLYLIEMAPKGDKILDKELLQWLETNYVVSFVCVSPNNDSYEMMANWNTLCQ